MALYKRGKTWWLAFSLNGKMVYKSTGQIDRTLATTWADEYKTQCRKGEADPFAPKGPIPTVSEVLAKYFEVHLKTKNPRTYAESSRYRVTPLLKHFGADTPMTKIRPRLDLYQAWRVTECKVSLA